MKEKLIESAAIYEKDTGTISWDVFQDINNPQKFGIVEKFESKDHTKYRESL
jgi:quinol monooxygenase YgiN